MTGSNFSSWFNQAEGTLYADASTKLGVPIGRAVEILGSIASFTLGFSSDQTWVEAYYPPNPYVDAYSSGGIDSKISFSYATLSAARAVDGTVNEISGVAYSYGQNGLLMGIGGQANGGGQTLNGTIRKIAYYPIRVSNTNLQALTS